MLLYRNARCLPLLAACADRRSIPSNGPGAAEPLILATCSLGTLYRQDGDTAVQIPVLQSSCKHQSPWAFGVIRKVTLEAFNIMRHSLRESELQW